MPINSRSVLLLFTYKPFLSGCCKTVTASESNGDNPERFDLDSDGKYYAAGDRQRYFEYFPK